MYLILFSTKCDRCYDEISLLTDSLAYGEFTALQDETELEFASGSLRVLHTPGHTPGSCSFSARSGTAFLFAATVF